MCLVTVTRKVNLLYEKAHGRPMNASSDEKAELRKYRVTTGDDRLATKINLTAYVRAVDSGKTSAPFYDYCYNNNRGDRRRRGHSKKEMAETNRDQALAVMFVGWLSWGVCIYWLLGQRASVGACAAVGALISVIGYRMNRRIAAGTLILLPLGLLGLVMTVFR